MNPAESPLIRLGRTTRHIRRWVHTTMAETTGSARPGSVSHSMRCPELIVLIAPSVGARIQRHITAIAGAVHVDPGQHVQRAEQSRCLGSRRASRRTAVPVLSAPDHDRHEDGGDHSMSVRSRNRSAPTASWSGRRSAVGPASPTGRLSHTNHQDGQQIRWRPRPPGCASRAWRQCRPPMARRAWVY